MEDTEEKNLYSREYYKNNKEKIFKKNKAINSCPNCGRNVQHTYLNRHMKTDLCKNTTSLKVNNPQLISEQINKLRKQLKDISTLLDN